MSGSIARSASMASGASGFSGVSGMTGLSAAMGDGRSASHAAAAAGAARAVFVTVGAAAALPLRGRCVAVGRHAGGCGRGGGEGAKPSSFKIPLDDDSRRGFAGAGDTGRSTNGGLEETALADVYRKKVAMEARAPAD